MDSDQKDELYERVADEIISSIYRQTVATPFSILSCVITSYHSAIEENILREGFHTFLDYLAYLECNTSESLHDEQSAFDEAYSLLKSKRLITIDEPDNVEEARLLHAEGENRIHLEYYKNTVLNFFVPASLICNVILKDPQGLDEKSFNEKLMNLAGLLENEFILDASSFKKPLQYLIERNIVTYRKGAYAVSETGRKVAVMFDGLLENYLESYLCVAKFVLKTRDLGKKDPLKAINRFASRIYKKGEIQRYEALCLPVYKGALDTFRSKNLIDEKNTLVDEKSLAALIRDLESLIGK
jgi:glycerol-3-phosphate O-acyltransferase